jgi:hypothetical protein
MEPLQLDASSRLIVNCATGCAGSGGTSLADEGTFTQGTTSFTPIGGYYNSSITNLTSGQGGSVRLTADRNLFSNLNEIAGNAVSTAATGVQKVGVVGNAGAAIDAATGAAPPANAILTGTLGGGATGGHVNALIQADSSAAINVSTATTTQLVALSAGQKIYVTSFDVIAGGTGNITFEYGTGTNCATGTTTLTGAYNLIAQSGIAKGNGLGPVLVVPASNALCVLTSAAVQMSGSLSYAQF